MFIARKVCSVKINFHPISTLKTEIHLRVFKDSISKKQKHPASRLQN